MTDRVNRREFLAKCARIVGALAAYGIPAAGLAAEQAAAPREHAPALPRRTLGRTGLSVTILGLGGAGFQAAWEDKDAAAQLIREAIDGGINYLDTAHNYGRSEENLGVVMGTPYRKRVILATKTEDRTYDGALREVESSLKALQTDYLDIIQIHYVYDKDEVASFGRKDGVLTALWRLRDEKVVRFIGMTGHPTFPQVKEALATYEFDTFMCFVNPLAFSRPTVEEQLPIAQKKQMGIIAMKVFGGGQQAALVGEGEGKAPARLLLRHALGQAITVAIPGIMNREQLIENLDVARNFTPLSPEETTALRAQLNPPGKTARLRGITYPFAHNTPT